MSKYNLVQDITFWSLKTLRQENIGIILQISIKLTCKKKIASLNCIAYLFFIYILVLLLTEKVFIFKRNMSSSSQLHYRKI